MIIHTRIESPHLAGNLLGDPSERDLFVYVPPGYEESDRRYPTAYLFHAYGVTAAQEVTPATDGQRWSPPLEDVLDPVFGRMGVPPMIVAIPDGWSRWGCGQWVDSPVTGPVLVQSSAHGAAVPAIFDGEHVRFAARQRAVAPGQSVVLYDDDDVLGGGIAV